MPQAFSPDYTKALQELMQRLGFSSYRQLCQKAGVSEKQLRRLRQGNIAQMRVETLLKLAETLQLSLNELLTMFSELGGEKANETAILKQEYERLQQQLQSQRETLLQEFQRASLQVLESFLIFFPSAEYQVQQKPELPAANVLKLVQPVKTLVQGWGVEAIASVGAEIPFDPQQHQLIQGTAQPGEIVRVRNIGYRQGNKLLYRAKVSST